MDVPSAAREWEEQGTYVPFREGDLFVVDIPAGDDVGKDPIFVLHGFPTASFDWHLVVDALSANRRVVLFDFPGFGLSWKPDVRYSIELYADAAEAVAVATGLERVALVTHDMGDTVGGELLARDLDGKLPFEVSTRVLTNGSIYIGMAQLTAGQQMLLEAPDERVDLAALGIDPAEGFKGGVAATFGPDTQPAAEEMDAHWYFASHADGHQLLPRTIRYIEDRRANEERFTGAIETHPSPVGVIWGRLDPVAVYPMAERLVAARPGTPLVTLGDVAHWPMLEAPDRFAAATLELLGNDGIDKAIPRRYT